MPTVRCPSCSTSQPVERSATAYTCGSCGASWTFVTCDTCGSRFHARPGSTGWTCPNCGTPHGTAADAPTRAPQPAEASPALAIKGDDLEAAEPEPLGGPQQPYGAQEPGSAFPMPRRAERRSIPPWVYVGAGALVVLVIAVFLLTRGGEDEQPATPTTAAAAKAAVCTDVQQLQTLRTDALGRAQDDLRADAEALKDAGDKATAAKVKHLVAAVDDYRAALDDQEDTGDASAAMGKAITALDC